ncbi:hypothetical protein DOM22_07060 [Bdellovibrio sp. ZAP7]|uniref:hypothetical protein n=1 Tax=Bdellovibrio sp. ZAP7 TaxID=2231053 RepID=UPI00115B8CB8|nr:hypothetical protein [Bdellovibrio sp. ZAP7]QDK44938.1 hypothetical protein DOM22_07060 [Bdellovibrio sp. ZAP7]
MKFFTSLVMAGLLLGTSYSFANDIKETAKEAAQDTKKNFKKGANRVEEAGCEMVNGKMECAGKKIKNRAGEVKEEVKDMAN